MSLKESCEDCINYEFRAESLGLTHSNPKQFIQFQWPCNQKVYVVYRIFMAGGFIAWLIADIFKETQSFFKDHTYTYIIYATNWSFLLLTFTAIYSAVVTVIYSVKHKDDLDRYVFDVMPASLKIQWLLKNISYNSAFVVSISYWSYIAVLEKDEVMQTTSSKVKHSLNSIYVLVDILLSGTPIRILHFIYTVILGFIYSVFNAIYFLNNGTILEGRHYAYNLLDWGEPSKAVVTCALCVVMCVFAQVVLYLFYRLRLFVYTKVFFGSDGCKSDAELQRIMGEPEVPVYRTLSESQSVHGCEDFATE